MTRKLTKREQAIAVVCFIFIIVYMVYIGVYRPLNSKVAQINAQIISQETKLKKNLKIIKEAQGLEDEYKAYLGNFAQSKPNEQVMSSILSEIEGSANKLGLRISDLKPKRVQKNDYYNQFSVSLTIDSHFEDIIYFLYTLQNEPYNFNVDEIRFDQGARSKGNMKSNVVLSKILIPS